MFYSHAFHVSNSNTNDLFFIVGHRPSSQTQMCHAVFLYSKLRLADLCVYLNSLYVLSVGRSFNWSYTVWVVPLVRGNLVFTTAQNNRTVFIPSTVLGFRHGYRVSILFRIFHTPCIRGEGPKIKIRIFLSITKWVIRLYRVDAPNSQYPYNITTDGIGREKRKSH